MTIVSVATQDSDQALEGGHPPMPTTNYNERWCCTPPSWDSTCPAPQKSKDQIGGTTNTTLISQVQNLNRTLGERSKVTDLHCHRLWQTYEWEITTPNTQKSKRVVMTQLPNVTVQSVLQRRDSCRQTNTSDRSVNHHIWTLLIKSLPLHVLRCVRLPWKNQKPKQIKPCSLQNTNPTVQGQTAHLTEQALKEAKVPKSTTLVVQTPTVGLWMPPSSSCPYPSGIARKLYLTITTEKAVPLDALIDMAADITLTKVFTHIQSLKLTRACRSRNVPWRFKLTHL